MVRISAVISPEARRVRVPSAPQKGKQNAFLFLFMEYFVYIIQSERSGIFYKGYTSYPLLRLEEHNKGKSRYTAGKGPWKMVYLEKMIDKRTALIRERQLTCIFHSPQFYYQTIAAIKEHIQEFFPPDYQIVY